MALSLPPPCFFLCNPLCLPNIRQGIPIHQLRFLKQPNHLRGEWLTKPNSWADDHSRHGRAASALCITRRLKAGKTRATAQCMPCVHSYPCLFKTLWPGTATLLRKDGLTTLHIDTGLQWHQRDPALRVPGSAVSPCDGAKLRPRDMVASTFPLGSGKPCHCALPSKLPPSTQRGSNPSQQAPEEDPPQREEGTQIRLQVHAAEPEPCHVQRPPHENESSVPLTDRSDKATTHLLPVSTGQGHVPAPWGTNRPLTACSRSRPFIMSTPPPLQPLLGQLPRPGPSSWKAAAVRAALNSGCWDCSSFPFFLKGPEMPRPGFQPCPAVSSGPRSPPHLLLLAALWSWWMTRPLCCRA